MSMIKIWNGTAWVRVGIQGPQGEQGLTGPEGPQGIQGVPGPTGDTGIQGPQGIQGPIGLTGPQGDAGPQGIQGLIGDTGPQGPIGNTGAQGLQGIQGVPGQGVPTGGTVGQVLTKINSTDYNTQWQSILNLVYPVGAIYMSVVNTSPATLFGGTWEVWGTGRVPVGIDTEQTEFNTIEKTGGAKTHTLTIQELPSAVWHTIGTLVGGVKTLFNSGTTFGINSSSTDANQPHNNLQPYITCYMWKRTA